MRKSAIELMMEGYGKTEKEHLDKDLTKNEATKQGDTTDFMGNKLERELTAVEKMANGYGADGTQKDKEVNVDTNHIKDLDELVKGLEKMSAELATLKGEGGQ